MTHSRLVLLIVLLAGFVPLAARALDIEQAKDIMGVCASCHGELGQGGKHGEYPRLAGQQARYMADQLRAFRTRHRINIPMIPYTEERELSDEDISVISEYLASLKLQMKMPVFRGDEDALTRLLAVDKVMIVPRVEGNIDHGRDVYEDQCGFCHGKTGRGGGRYPMLIGQYTNYLQKQMSAYIRGERPHDEDEPKGVLNTLKESELQDVLAYLTSIQGDEP
jgi:cytochrome c553